MKTVKGTVKLTENDYAKVYESVIRYGEDWRKHARQMEAIKFNLSINGQLDFDTMISTAYSLIESASDSYRTYLIEKLKRGQAI